MSFEWIIRCFLFSSNVSQYKAIQVTFNLVRVFIESENFNLAKEEISKEFKKLSDELNFKMPQLEFENYFFDKHKKLKRVERIF